MPLLDRTEEVEGLRTSLSWSPQPSLRPSFPVREEVNPSQRREAADVVVEADHEDESGGRDQDDAGHGRGPGEVGGRDTEVTAGRDLTGLEVGAEVENVVSPKVVGDEPSLGPGQTTEAGRIAAVTRLLSLPCSRKYQVKLLVARLHPS